MSTLKEKTAKGLLWGSIGQVGMQLISFAIGIYLARRLDLSDYGIVGMIAIFTALAGNLQDSGFSVALVNRKGEETRDLNAVFWFNIGMSLSLYALLFLCAPLIAAYFRQPCLIPLTRFVCIGFVFSGLGIVPGALLTKRLMVKQKTIITFAAMLISGGVGVALAYAGFRYWALAFQQVVYNFVTCVCRYYYSRWHPVSQWDFTPVREMLPFSIKVLIPTMLNTLNNNLLSFIIGRLYAPSQLGSYTQANKWNTMASSVVSGTLAQVAQPVLLEVGDKQERQVRVFRKMLRFTALLTFPCMFGLALVAREFILLTITEKWISSVPLLRLLCVGGAFLPFYTLYQNLFLSQGRSDVYVRFNVCQILLQLAAVLLCSLWGFTAMVAATSAVLVFWLLPWQWAARRSIGLTFGQALRDTMPFMFIAAAVMLGVYFLTLPIHNLWLLLLVRILLAALIYFVVLKCLHAEILEECLRALKKKKFD